MALSSSPDLPSKACFTLPSPIPEHKTEDHTKIVQTLSSLNQIERSKAFSTNFTRDERPVHSIGTIIGHPEILQTYPQFEAEIFESYLANTLFVAEVKTPYDIATEDFSKNFGACGKIVRPDTPRVRNSDPSAPYTTQVNRVRFDIRSPFTSVLCHVFVTLHQAEGGHDGDEECVAEKIIATVSPVSYGHELLFGYLEKACQAIMEQKIEGQHMGFSFENMEAIATFFVPQQISGFGE